MLVLHHLCLSPELALSRDGAGFHVCLKCHRDQTVQTPFRLFCEDKCLVHICGPPVPLEKLEITLVIFNNNVWSYQAHMLLSNTFKSNFLSCSYLTKHFMGHTKTRARNCINSLPSSYTQRKRERIGGNYNYNSFQRS